MERTNTMPKRATRTPMRMSKQQLFLNQLNAEQLREYIEQLKWQHYTSPKDYGLMLLGKPMHKRKYYQTKSSREFKVCNF